MSVISTKANSVYRDNGPSGAPYKPPKSAIRDLFATIDGLAGAASDFNDAAQDAATRAENYAILAQNLVSGQIGTGETFGPLDADGTDVTFTMHDAVAAGNEWTVMVWVHGILQQTDAYFCNGTTTLTFNAPPAFGTGAVYGVHVAVGTAVTFEPPPFSVTPTGPSLTAAQRFSRFRDVRDCPGILMDGVSDDGPGLVEALTEYQYLTHAYGELNILTDITLPDLSSLMIGTGTIKVATGITLTSGPLNRVVAPEWLHVWTGAGSVADLNFATFENFGAAGDGTENDAPECTKAFASSQFVKGLDRAYAVAEPVMIKPTLFQPKAFHGGGTGLSGSGTRFVPIGTGHRAVVYVLCDVAGVASLVDLNLENFTIETGEDFSGTHLLVTGAGGASDIRLTGLINNTIKNVHTPDAAIGFEILSCNRLIVENCTAIAATREGMIGHIVSIAPGGQQCTEIDLKNSTFAPLQTGSTGGGRGGMIIDDDVGVSDPSVAEARAVTYHNCQIYAGYLGITLEHIVTGAVGKTRTSGDVSVDSHCKLQGDGGGGSITAISAYKATALNGGKISLIDLQPTQMEGFNGNVVDCRVSRSSPSESFGDIAVVKVRSTIRYANNRSGYFDGVRGLRVECEQEYCGLTSGATANEHWYLLNCKSSRITNTMTTSKDGTRGGLPRGIYVVGSNTVDVKTWGNSMGTSSAYFKETTGTGLVVTDTETGDGALGDGTGFLASNTVQV